MTVKELKKILEEFEDDDMVVMSKDGEGNGYSPLADYGTDYYIADSTWSGEIYPRDYDEDYHTDEETFEEIKQEGKKCITLWPTN